MGNIDWMPFVPRAVKSQVQGVKEESEWACGLFKELDFINFGKG